MKTNGHTTQRTLLVAWKEIQPVDRQQTPAVQIHNYTYMDIWHWTMGLRFQVQYRSNTAMSV
jgi:hypothetical protein